MPAKIVEMFGVERYVHHPTASDELGICNTTTVYVGQTPPSRDLGWELYQVVAPTVADYETVVEAHELDGWTLVSREGTPGKDMLIRVEFRR